MKKIKLDSILLFCFVIPFIMGYRIGPSDTPYWLFGLIFLLLGIYFLLDILAIKEIIYTRYKTIILWMVFITVIGSAFFSAMIVRHQTAPIYMIHDIILQQEAAIQFLLDGKNPYRETYFGTPLEDWHYSDNQINPALYHFVMQPLYLLFAIPFYLISHRTIGFFDGRIPLLFLFGSMLVITQIFGKDEEKKRLFLILLAFNPAMLGYTLEGRSDIFMFPFLLVSCFLLIKRYYSISGIFLGCAFAIKQSVWPILPFYLAYVFYKEKKIKIALKTFAAVIMIFFGFIFPFILWDSNAFFSSTIGYLSGNVVHSYPISGYGFGSVLHQLGIIKNLTTYYPFIYWQIIICVPLLFVMIKWMKKNNSVSSMMLLYGIFLFVFWYFSRYFNNSHLGYLSVIFISSYFLQYFER